jgi:hypothetical protein
MDENYLIAASLGNVKSTAWFNAKFPHSIPLSLHTLNRAILKNLAGDEYDMSLVNEPFSPRSDDETLEESRARKVSTSHLLELRYHKIEFSESSSSLQILHNTYDVLPHRIVSTSPFHHVLHQGKGMPSETDTICVWSLSNRLLDHVVSFRFHAFLLHLDSAVWKNVDL